MVGDSVFEDATLTIRDGRLHIEFDAPDLDNVTVDLREVATSDDLARKVLLVDGLAKSESDDHEALARIVALATDELGAEPRRGKHDRLLSEWDTPIR